MTQREKLNLRWLTWADLLTTGIDERQLRGAIDRGLIPLGAKGTNGRLQFSLSEKFAVQVMRELTRLWLPISVAATAARKVASDLNVLINYKAKLGAQKIGPGDLSFRLSKDDRAHYLEYYDGDLKYRPGRGVSEERDAPRSCIVIHLNDLIDELLGWSETIPTSGLDDNNPASLVAAQSDG